MLASVLQELVIPQILPGGDIVLAAETGSGKTLAYIAPLASMLLQKALTGQNPPAVDVIRGSKSSSSGYRPKTRCEVMHGASCPRLNPYSSMQQGFYGLLSESS